MFLGHTSGDNAFLKQGIDAVPIPVEDGMIVSMGFSEGEITFPEFQEESQMDMALVDCLYEDVVENYILDTDEIGSDMALGEGLYEEVIFAHFIPDDETTMDMALTDCTYEDAIIETSLDEAVGYAVNIGPGNYHDAIEATGLMIENVGYGISIGSGSHV